MSADRGRRETNAFVGPETLQNGRFWVAGHQTVTEELATETTV